MAEATKIILPRLRISPSTLQYHKPRSGPPIFYKERFKLPKEQYEKTLGQAWLEKKDPLMPAYPYLEDKNRFPEANHGLYGGATIQSGSKISKGRNKGKTLRKWFPNVKVENLRSQALKRTLTIPVTARVKRTIVKCGGIDQYLLGGKPARIKELGLLGWKLRWHVSNALVAQGKVAEYPWLQRKADQLNETFGEAWSNPEKRAGYIAEQIQTWSGLKQKDQRFKDHMETRLQADKVKSPYVPAAVRTLQVLSPELLKLDELTVEDETPRSAFLKLEQKVVTKKPIGDDLSPLADTFVGAESAEEVAGQAAVAETLAQFNLSEPAVEADASEVSPTSEDARMQQKDST